MMLMYVSVIRKYAVVISDTGFRLIPPEMYKR